LSGTFIVLIFYIFSLGHLYWLCMRIVTVLIFLSCIGFCLVSWLGFWNLRREQRLVQSIRQYSHSHPEILATLPNFNSVDISNLQTMCNSASCLLFYAIFCCYFAVKELEFYEYLFALSGFFIFILFVCRQRTSKIISDFWKSR
jgi:hypothetical protein